MYTPALRPSGPKAKPLCIRTLAQALPNHGGVFYQYLLKPLQDCAQSHEIVGIDRAKAAPGYDPSDSTSLLAAQVLLNLLRGVFEARKG